MTALSVIDYFRPDLPRCGATEHFDCDQHPGSVYVFRCCNLPAGHESRFHQEWRDGLLWGESSGHPDPMPDAPRCDHLRHA